MHEYDKSMLAARLKKALKTSSAKTGKHEGKKPYGHYPGEAETVEYIKRLRAEGLAFDKMRHASMLRKCRRAPGSAGTAASSMAS
jgi:hypothetical protein